MWGCYQSLLRLCILYISKKRGAAVLNTRSMLRQFWKAGTLLSCPEAIPLPHFPYLTLYSFMHSSKKAAKWCFFFPNLSPPATVWLFTMAENKHLGGDKICPPCCWGYCCRHTAELTFERIHLPYHPHSFSASLSYLCWRETGQGNKNEEGRGRITQTNIVWQQTCQFTDSQTGIDKRRESISEVKNLQREKLGCIWDADWYCFGSSVSWLFVPSLPSFSS